MSIFCLFEISDSWILPVSIIFENPNEGVLVVNINIYIYIYNTTSVIEIPIIQVLVPDDSQATRVWVNLITGVDPSTLKGSSVDVAFQRW